MSDQFRLIMGMSGGFVDDFDPHREYEFKRLGTDGVSVFRLADQNPAFNVHGLLFRELAHPCQGAN